MQINGKQKIVIVSPIDIMNQQNMATAQESWNDTDGTSTEPMAGDAGRVSFFSIRLGIS